MAESLLQPVEAWFEERGWTPFPFQREVWQAYLDGESGLIHSPTGTGKTYAAFLGAVLQWLNANPNALSKSVKRAQTTPFTVLWITPLRALSADTARTLETVIEHFGLPWSLETRTSDTPSSVRNRQGTRLPTVLITTPESFSLLLSRPNARELFQSIGLMVVDEWHELMSGKRGTQTELGLARLRRWQSDVRVWGLSATMGNLDVALRSLLGMFDLQTGEIPDGRLVRGDVPKQLVIDSIIPPKMERFPWAGHLGLKLLPQVVQAVDKSRTTLIFTNTRSQTEMWFQALLDARPDWAGVIALHHSSLDPKTRLWVEEGLRNASLKCVVCTSSLDLGVDFPTVDRVFQVGSPKGVARLIQRAGRSGHQPQAVSRVTCVPSHALELIEVAAARWSIEHEHIEARPPVEKPLDVLAQHLVTLGLGGGFDDDVYDEVRTTYAYRNLTRDEWDWTLQFVG
ncbi:MAG: DEAD/DEAH box helicase, partial [Burkholderiales bacterium]|nr:DEAD/DEAH box helicase [Anaerolineae bacterium]